MAKRQVYDLPACRGVLTRERRLADLTWMRVGGAAELFFQPADVDDLVAFLKQLDRDISVFAMGVGSNLIVRDGGISGLVVRLGRPFAKISIGNGQVRAGAAALLSRVAQLSAQSGYDLTFLRTIPGTVGGAVRMNAGCYGSSIKDVCRQIRYITRDGESVEMTAEAVGFGYRSSDIPKGAVIVEAIFECHTAEDQSKLETQMEAQIEIRNQSQPANMRTAGSTFRNPSGFSSTGKEDDMHELKAWKLIDDAGMRGQRRGGAAVSQLHPNFLVNLGDATAAEIEELGEEVRQKVRETSGIELEWEIIRVGDKLPNDKDHEMAV